MAAARRRPGPAPRISREAVLDAARGLAPADMSMAAIGQRLGVSGPAIYRYFPDRAAILEALAHEAREQLDPPDPSLPWPEWVVQAARMERSLWTTNVDLYEAANYRAIARPQLRMVHVGLQVLTAAGFSSADALTAIVVIGELAHAIGREETRQEALIAADVIADADLPSLVPEGIPTLDELFEQGVAVVIDGLRARLPAAGGA